MTTRKQLLRVVVLLLLAIGTTPRSLWATPPQKWALLIGIDQYGNEEEVGRLTPLVGAVADAESLGKALVRYAGFPEDHVTLITTRPDAPGAPRRLKPIKNTLLRELTKLQNRVKKGDIVFVFYAGHGCEDKEAGVTYLLPADADSGSVPLLKDTALSMLTFNRYLQQLPASLLVMTFDMCRVEVGRDGSTATTEEMQSRGMEFKTAQKEDDDLPQVVVRWFACKPGQKSFENRNRRRGYFSHWVEQGLSGAAAQNGALTLANLLNYVGPQVRSEVNRLEGEKQEPKISFDGVSSLGDLDRFVLAGEKERPIPTRATLLIKTTPRNATITVDGKIVSDGRYTVNLLDVMEKTVQVKIEADGYEGALYSTTLKRGETIEKTYILDKIAALTPPLNFVPTKVIPLFTIRENGGSTWSRQDTANGHTTTIGSSNTVAFSPDGQRIVTSGNNYTARVRDANIGKEILTLKGHYSWVLAASFSQDGKRIVTCGSDTQAKVWSASTGKELLQFSSSKGSVRTVVLSPDGQRVVAGNSEGLVQIFDATSGNEIFSFKADSQIVWILALSPDGKRIVTGGLGNSARVWDANTGTSLLILKGHNSDIRSVAFSSDGQRIVTGSDDNSARVWDANTGKPLLTFKGHRDWILSVAFSPDGKYIITGSFDKTARIWDASTARLLFTLDGDDRPVSSVAFSPDGKHFVTSTDDNTTKMWELQ